MEGGVDSARAWRVATAASVIVGVSFGTIYSFGAFFDAMADEFAAGLGTTSIVFSVTVFLFFGTGAASGFAADRWGARPLVWVGGAMFAAGLAATSQVTALWQGHLTYGLGLGLGGGLFLSPLFAISAAWFDRRRAVAQGLVATGSGLGTLLLLPLAERVIDGAGWRDAYLVLAAITAVTFLVGGVLIERPPVPPARPGFARVRAVLTTRAFRRLGLAGTLQSGSMLSAFAFLVPFTTDDGVSSSTAALLVGLIGASSIVGRLALTGLAGQVGPVRMLQLSFVVQPMAFLIWWLAGDSVPLLVLFVVVLGVAYGGFVALIGVVTAHLFGVEGLGAIMGWVYLAGGAGSLVFPPLVGFIADASSTHTPPILTAALLSAVGAAVLLGLQREPVGDPGPVVAAAPPAW